MTDPASIAAARIVAKEATVEAVVTAEIEPIRNGGGQYVVPTRASVHYETAIGTAERVATIVLSGVDIATGEAAATVLHVPGGMDLPEPPKWLAEWVRDLAPRGMEPVRQQDPTLPIY